MDLRTLSDLIETQLRQIIEHAGGDLSIDPMFGDDGVSTYTTELIDAILEAGVIFAEEVK